MEDASVNCLQIFDWKDEIRTYFNSYALSKKLGTPQYWERALKLIIHRFEESVFSIEFMRLELNFAVEILSADMIGARSEVIVFLAALNWLNYDYVNRKVHAVTMMKCVRFSSMTMEEILACYHPPLLSHVVQIPEVMTMLFRATCYIAAKSQDQEVWFREYASPIRILSLDGLPMELWHKSTIRRNFESTDPRKTDSYRPAYFKDYSGKFKTDSGFSRHLKDPAEVVAGHTGLENRYREQESASFISGCHPQVTEGKDTRFIDLPPYPNSSYSVPSADELLSNLPILNELDEEFKNELKPFQGKFTEISPSVTRLKHNDSLSRGMKDVRYVIPGQAKIIHLSSGPQRFSSLQTKLVPEDLSYLDCQKFSKKELDKKKLHPPEEKFTKQKTSVSEDRSPSKVAKESYLEKDQVEKQQGESSHRMFPSTSDKKTKGEREKKENTYIFVVGGMNPLNLTKEMGEILVLDPISNRWTGFEKLPESRHNHGAAYLDGCLYIVGGCNHEETIKSNRYVAKRSCFKLDFKMMTWRQIAKMECCRYDHGLVAHNGRLFSIGGQDESGRLLKSIEVYDPRRNRWKFLQQSMCCGRKAMGVAVHAHRIWIVGGLIESGENNKLQAISYIDCYHPEERKWYFNLYSLPGSRCFSSLAVWEEKLYCIGGMVSSSEGRAKTTNEVWFTTTENEVWKAGPNLPDARMGGVAVVFRDNLYFLGGYEPDNASNNGNVSILTSNSASWNAGPTLPFPLFGLSAVTVTIN